jgi:hypothetical protein
MAGTCSRTFPAENTQYRQLLRNWHFPRRQESLLKDSSQTLNLELKVAATTQEISVQEKQGPAVSTDPTANVGALVLRGDDLDALADDPDDLAADLQALAGPSAGPSGTAFFIDGFSGGQLPSKESIREIRIRILHANRRGAADDRPGRSDGIESSLHRESQPGWSPE